MIDYTKVSYNKKIIELIKQIEEIAKRIAELHYPNKPNAIIDEPYRLVRMKTLRQQVETELKNISHK